MTTTWRERIKVHPTADLFPMMADDELDELAADIEKHGLRQAIDFQGDQLLDGRNRLAAIHRIKDETRRNNLLGFVASTKRVMQVSDPIAYVISANVRRRHLSAEQKRDLIAALLKDNPGRSDRATAQIARASHPTVAAVRRELENSGDVEKFSTRSDTAGRQQPASKPPKPPSKEAQIRALREQKPAVIRSQAAAQPPTDDVDALQALLLTLRGDPRRIAGIPLDRRIGMARTCLAWLNLTPDDLRAS
jgi:ParB-like chromosome segregation protein Spo0J